MPSPRTNELPATGPERENTARLPLPSTIAGSHPGGNVFVPTVVAAGPIHDSCADSAPGWIAVHSASLDTATQPAFRGGATDAATPGPEIKPPSVSSAGLHCAASSTLDDASPASPAAASGSGAITPASATTSAPRPQPLMTSSDKTNNRARPCKSLAPQPVHVED